MKLNNLIAVVCFLVYFVASTALAEKTVSFKRKKSFPRKLKTFKELNLDTTTIIPITFATSQITSKPSSKASLETKKLKKSRKKTNKKSSKKKVTKLTIKIDKKTEKNKNSSLIGKEKLNNIEKQNILSTQTSTSEINPTVTKSISVSQINTQSSTSFTNTQSRPPTTTPITHQNEDIADEFQINDKQNHDEKSRQETVNHTTIINEATSNSNNNFTYNINHNNYYLVSSQLDDFLKNIPLPPPYLNLPPPPLPPFMVGCEEEQYQWKVVKKETEMKNENSKKGNEEGERMKRCERKFYNIDDFFDEKRKTPLVKRFKEKQKNEEKRDFYSSNEEELTNQEPPEHNEIKTSKNEFLYKLKSVPDYNSMRRLQATEGCMVYRTDLKLPFIMTDRWKAIKLGTCGNGEIEEGEGCDDGNVIDEDSCKNDCSLNTCGDGVKSIYEECDGDDFSDNEIFYCRDKAAVTCSKDCKVEC